MKKWVLILISVVLLILDNSLMPFLAIRGAFPSLLFTFAIACSIVSGRKEAVTIGVISGLLQDIYFYEGFGINSLINMLICLLAAIIGENIYNEKSNGEIVELYKDGIGIKVSDGEIILKIIKPSGSKKMSVKDYLNGFEEKNNLIGKVFKWIE